MKAKNQKEKNDAFDFFVAFALIGAAIGMALATSPSGQQKFIEVKNEMLGIIEKKPKREHDKNPPLDNKSLSLEELLEILAVHVKNEHYEDAAVVRDMIKDIKK